eukprot:gene47796-21296_t
MRAASTAAVLAAGGASACSFMPCEQPCVAQWGSGSREQQAGPITMNCNADMCRLPKVVGNCRAAFPRWFFNPEADKCEQFTYGGCGANANNFETADECKHACPATGFGPEPWILPVNSCQNSAKW